MGSGAIGIECPALSYPTHVIQPRPEGRRPPGNVHYCTHRLEHALDPAEDGQRLAAPRREVQRGQQVHNGAAGEVGERGRA